MFTFSRFVNGGSDALYSETKNVALSGYALYVGQALKLTGGALGYAETADTVYAISNTSAASSVVTAAFVPTVFPVNDNQIWKASVNTAITAATVAGSKINLSSTVALSTGVNGAAAGTGLLVHSIATANDPITSALYVIFAPSI